VIGGVKLVQKVEKEFAGRQVSIEVGELAKQAHGSAIVRYADTVVFAAAVHGKQVPEAGFLPLQVDYREKTYAAGKFPGGFFKREGRPTTKEVLTSRIIDRPIRPLLPEGYKNEIAINSLVLSADQENDPDTLAILASSTALMLSGIPFKGPVAGVRVGQVGGNLVVNPTHKELAESALDLFVCGTKDAIIMVEGSGKVVKDSTVLEAILFGWEKLKELVYLQEELLSGCKVEPIQYELEIPDPEILDYIRSKYSDEIGAKSVTPGKWARHLALEAILEKIFHEKGAKEDEELQKKIRAAFDYIEREVVRKAIFEGVRTDGRKSDEIREISVKVGFLPRAHGSALFTRGETQALVATTLGTGLDAQLVEGLTPEYEKKFMLHYNFPSFSVRETWPDRGPRRREIGHGALAERAIEMLLPQSDQFPYTIRVVSDILESNGSSSMATVCGASLALMDAGVPISAPVAGVAMGLVVGEKGFTVLSDITGTEDHCGDMDLKIAGTQEGITALQMDIKVAGIDRKMLETALSQARRALDFILREMLSRSGLSAPRPSISKYAPKIAQVSIDPDKIGLLIGPQGRTVKKIQEETGTTIAIEEDGTVVISSTSEENIEKAKIQIRGLTEEVEVGKTYNGKVVAVREYGAFVEILPDKDGLCHISELADGFVDQVTDIVKIGDIIPVKVLSIDDQDRIRLSRRAALDPDYQEKPKPKSGGRPQQ
jgi:polyribonucleotide nucleotidyltransferase